MSFFIAFLPSVLGIQTKPTKPKGTQTQTGGYLTRVVQTDRWVDGGVAGSRETNTA